MQPGERPRFRQFCLTKTHIDGHRLSCHYRLAAGEADDIDLVETVDLPKQLPPPDLADAATAQLVDACHRLLGVSYYKAALPPQLIAPPLADDDARFFDRVYRQGLGEFYCRNGLTIPETRLFPWLPSPREVASEPRSHPSARERALVMIGGGKDSAVMLAMVKQSDLNAVALSIGGSPWAERQAAAAGLPLLVVKRTIDPTLLALNAQGAWNGHVPVSACYAALAALVAHLGGFSHVLVGNERGADEATCVIGGVSFNHQWSKSSSFEQPWQDWLCRQQLALPGYLSWLRPMSEWMIAHAFARLPEHWPHFASCNRQFTLTGHGQRWCGDCPKCIFLYLLLAVHLPAEALATIFGRELWTATANRYLPALLGLTESKPWECVGTVQECRLALSLLADRGPLPEVLASLVDKHPELIVRGEARERVLDAEMSAVQPPTMSPEWWQRWQAAWAKMMA